MKKIFYSVTLASILLIASPAISQNYPNHDNNNRHENNRPDDKKDNGNHGQPNGQTRPEQPAVVTPVTPVAPNNGMRPSYNNNMRPPMAQPQPQQPQRYEQQHTNTPRPYHVKSQFRRGQRAPEQYRQQQYHVNDWQARRLSRPPSGYRWVRNDNNQFLLIAITSGIIWQIFANDNNNNYQIWSYGERLPYQYRRSGYYVNDWRAHRLSRPQAGRRWVHVNHQYLLIVINTGQIRAVVSDY